MIGLRSITVYLDEKWEENIQISLDAVDYCQRSRAMYTVTDLGVL
jgi:hypothetical protein